MKIKTSFIEGIDRYSFDFGPCSPDKGFAQVDTPEDAHYYGVWCNPSTLQIVEYAEGDVTSTFCDTSDEFCEKLRAFSKRYKSTHGKAARIDPGLKESMIQSFAQLGLADLTH